GVTANAIAPSAATRLTATVPDAQRVRQDGPGEEDLSRSPDNVAPICAYLASERSSWLSGRTIAAGGFGVDLYSNPEIIASATSDGPWNLEDLATKVEANFKPVADGLPYSLFAGQVQRAAAK
ncbi:MAG: short-chain dehydrogenase, partial [Pseudonocardiales bacterium]|nr:short-chain dehydrogenase [Pseudonocardiales bacterium]